MLSVIVPIYNVEQYLPKCIKSILNQTYKDLEVLLINDGSTDRCPEICKTFMKLDSRVKVFNQTNKGLVQARKMGLNLSKGNYITFVDGDDWIESDMYFELMKNMLSTEADFIDSGFFYDKNGINYSEKRLKKNTYILDDYVKHKFFLSLLNLENFVDISQNIWSKIFKADLITNAYKNVPDNMNYGEDVISLIYCILNANTVVQIEKNFYHYNYRNDSLSHIKEISMLRKELLLWEYCGKLILKNDKFMKQYDLDKTLFDKIYNIFLFLNNNRFDVIQYYIFSRIEELFGKKIVLYGAGRVGKDYLTQISKYENCEIVCWVDKNYKNYNYEYRKVVGIEYFLKLQYDYVVIAIENEKIAEEVIFNLLNESVPREKILWYAPQILG